MWHFKHCCIVLFIYILTQHFRFSSVIMLLILVSYFPFFSTIFFQETGNKNKFDISVFNMTCTFILDTSVKNKCWGKCFLNSICTYTHLYTKFFHSFEFVFFSFIHRLNRHFLPTDAFFLPLIRKFFIQVIMLRILNLYIWYRYYDWLFLLVSDFVQNTENFF